MSSGLFGFLGFGKKDKPNLTQNYQAPPSAQSSPMWGTLSEFAKRRIAGEDTGFGENWLSKTTNPAIAQSNARFQEQTVPFLNSQLSSRGVSRSAGAGLATDILGRAERSQRRDIDSMVADFYRLNEMQKKTDQSEGVRVGENLQGTFLDQGNRIAEEFNQAERGNVDRTFDQSKIRNAEAVKRQNQTIGAIMNMVVPGSGSTWQQGGNQPTAQQTVLPTKDSTSVKLASDADFQAWLNSFLG